jgi:hypothetical protein
MTNHFATRVNIEKDERFTQQVLSEETLKACAKGLRKHIANEKDIYKRERLRVIREEIKILQRQIYSL